MRTTVTRTHPVQPQIRRLVESSSFSSFTLIRFHLFTATLNTAFHFSRRRFLYPLLPYFASCLIPSRSTYFSAECKSALFQCRVKTPPRDAATPGRFWRRLVPSRKILEASGTFQKQVPFYSQKFFSFFLFWWPPRPCTFAYPHYPFAFTLTWLAL
jgi:hypothetical protein